VAENSNRHVALLAIHPVYAEAIFSGEKRVEFRKVRFRSDVGRVVVYVTTPVQRVVGYFEVARTIEAAPRTLWTKYRSCGGIGKQAFDEYYAGRDQGVAIEVGNVWRLRVPIALGRLRRGLVPPQGYTYLDPALLRRMDARCVVRSAAVRMGDKR